MPLEEDRPGTAFPHWPAGIQARGEVRSQYAHAIDMAPTVLEALGVEAQAQVHSTPVRSSTGQLMHTAPVTT